MYAPAQTEEWCPAPCGIHSGRGGEGAPPTTVVKKYCAPSPRAPESVDGKDACAAGVDGMHPCAVVRLPKTAPACGAVGVAGRPCDRWGTLLPEAPRPCDAAGAVGGPYAAGAAEGSSVAEAAVPDPESAGGGLYAAGADEGPWAENRTAWDDGPMWDAGQPSRGTLACVPSELCIWAAWSRAGSSMWNGTGPPSVPASSVKPSPTTRGLDATSVGDGERGAPKAGVPGKTHIGGGVAGGNDSADGKLPSEGRLARRAGTRELTGVDGAE